MKPVRKLRNLFVREVSLVDRAANPLATVKLAKRDNTEDTTPMLNAGSFDWLCGAIAKRDNINKTAAINKVLQSKIGQALFAVAKAHDGSGQRSLAGAGSQASSDEVGRLRDAHDRKSLDKYNTIVRSLVASGYTPGQAHDKARAENGDMWESAKRARLLPLSHDGNVPLARGPYE